MYVLFKKCMHELRVMFVCIKAPTFFEGQAKNDSQRILFSAQVGKPSAKGTFTKIWMMSF
jgi:hypothetical protein